MTRPSREQRGREVRSRRLTDQERLWRSVPESQVVRDVINYLFMRGWLAWRNNTGGGRFQNKGSDVVRYVQFSTPGAADVFALRNGRFLAVEAKTETGKQSEDQQMWQQSIEANGGVYVLVRPSNYMEAIDAAIE